MFLRRGCSVGKVGKLSIPVLLWALAFIWKQPWVCKHCDWCQALFSCWETESSVVFPENIEPTVSHCCDRTMFGDVIIGFHKSAAHFLLGWDSIFQVPCIPWAALPLIRPRIHLKRPEVWRDEWSGLITSPIHSPRLQPHCCALFPAPHVGTEPRWNRHTQYGEWSRGNCVGFVLQMKNASQ